MEKKKFEEPELKELDKNMEVYINNSDFREYVDKYCQRDKITPERAVTHALVKAKEAEYIQKRI